jgi:hypothetical protein
VISTSAIEAYQASRMVRLLSHTLTWLCTIADGVATMCMVELEFRMLLPDRLHEVEYFLLAYRY